MALAKKCDRCGKLYENYDDIEINENPVNRLYTAFDGVRGPKTKIYDLCQDCCFDFARWIVDPGMEVREKIETRLFANGEELLTIKPNGEIELANQISLFDGEEVSEDET